MPKYYEFEVSLREISPKIWRRFLIQERATFLDLHDAIQTACGWMNSHLWAFRAAGRRGEDIAGVPDDSEELDYITPDARQVRLSSHFGESKARACVYEYDFGDSWEHDVKLKKVVEIPEVFERRLLGGERAFPPEDCGSTPGYYRCLDVLAGGKDPGLPHLREWIGDWKPERFEVEEVCRVFDIPRLSVPRSWKASPGPV